MFSRSCCFIFFVAIRYTFSRSFLDHFKRFQVYCPPLVYIIHDRKVKVRWYLENQATAIQLAIVVTDPFLIL